MKFCSKTLNSWICEILLKILKLTEIYEILLKIFKFPEIC